MCSQPSFCDGKKMSSPPDAISQLPEPPPCTSSTNVAAESLVIGVVFPVARSATSIVTRFAPRVASSMYSLSDFFDHLSAAIPLMPCTIVGGFSSCIFTLLHAAFIGADYGDLPRVGRPDELRTAARRAVGREGARRLGSVRVLVDTVGRE